MSYQVKRIIVSLVSGTALLAAYCLYAFNPLRLSASADAGLAAWAKTMLIFIGIGIVATIIIQIIFHILLSISIAVKKKIKDESCEDKEIERSINAEIVEDEMDKLIELKSSRIGFFVSGFGLVAGLVELAFGLSPVVMLNTVFLTFMAASLLEGVVQLVYYRKGV